MTGIPKKPQGVVTCKTKSFSFSCWWDRLLCNQHDDLLLLIIVWFMRLHSRKALEAQKWFRVKSRRRYQPLTLTDKITVVIRCVMHVLECCFSFVNKIMTFATSTQHPESLAFRCMSHDVESVQIFKYLCENINFNDLFIFIFVNTDFWIWNGNSQLVIMSFDGLNFGCIETSATSRFSKKFGKFSCKL